VYSRGTSPGKRAAATRGLRWKSNGELQRIVHENRQDAAVLGAVHGALNGRRRKKAIRLRTEIREQLGLDRVTGFPSPDIPIWTRAPARPRERPGRKWWYALALIASVAAGILLDVRFDFWRTMRQSVVQLGERWQVF